MGRKIKRFLSKVLTLSYPKYRIVIFLIVLILLTIIPLKTLESMPNLSICSRMWGDNCYSVGITRGVSCLLKGNFSKALEYNFLSIPVLGMIIGFILYDIKNILKKEKRGKTESFQLN